MAAITIPANASRSLMSALCFIRMASEYVGDVSRSIDAAEYRRIKLDRPVKLLRDAFNQLMGPITAEDQAKLQKELEQHAEVQAVIAQAITMNPESLEAFQKFGDELLQRQSLIQAYEK